MVAGPVGAPFAITGAGMTTAATAAPTSPDDVCVSVREAMDERRPLRVVGRGHWLDAGRPVRASKQLSMGSLSGIIDYVPGDLTLTALAGTTLGEVARTTAAESQWLALDPHGSANGSLGATVATASYGPLAHGLGLPRDTVLGLQVVTGAGTIVRAGGKVVKNVAGFDLTRLFTGSWGTLGVITEVTVRLRALPEVDETVSLSVSDGAERLQALLAQLRQAPMAPAALEMLDAALATRLQLGEQSCLLARFAGNADDVRAQVAALRRYGDVRGCAPTVWTALRESEPPRSLVLRMSAAPARLAAVWAAARAVVAPHPGALLHATVGRGAARCVVPPNEPGTAIQLAAAAAASGFATIFERLPVDAWRSVGSAIGHRLARGIKQRFDPLAIMNPGILGESA
jgi:glycolate oxidase FAD binding subunit